jgi:hypothetical protein
MIGLPLNILFFVVPAILHYGVSPSDIYMGIVDDPYI